MQVGPWVWSVFGGSIAGLLALDPFVFHRNAHAVSFNEAATWSASVPIQFSLLAILLMAGTQWPPRSSRPGGVPQSHRPMEP